MEQSVDQVQDIEIVGDSKQILIPSDEEGAEVFKTPKQLYVS